MRLTIPILGFTALVSALPQPSTPPPSFKITNVVSGGTGCPQGSINATWTDEQILPISTSTLLHPQAPVHQSTILTDTPHPRLRQDLHRIRRPHHRHHRVAQKLPAQPRPHIHPGLHIRRVQRHIRGVCRPRSRRDGRAEEHVLLLRVCGTSTSPPPFNSQPPTSPRGPKPDHRATPLTSKQTSSTLSLSGPTKATFKAHDDVPVAVWSPCGGTALFNVDVSVALAPAGAGRGVLGVARESGRWSESLGVVWRAC